MRYGILSDTHGKLHPEIPGIFAGVEEIFHAGDVGTLRVLEELEAVAPVVAVRGNMDYPPLVDRLPERQTLVREGKRIVLVHGHRTRAAKPAELLVATSDERPDVVIFGHTHKPLHEILDGVVFFNPGAAGKPRFGSKPTVGFLEIAGTEIRLEHHPLPAPFPAR